MVFRVVACLCVAQILAFASAWFVTVVLGLMGSEFFATSLDELSAIRAKKQVIASLQMSESGDIEIRPTPDLLADMRRSPGMKFAAFKSARRLALGGSSAELVEALTPLIAINASHVHFSLANDMGPIRKGMLEPQWTPFGRLHIAVYGQAFRFSDILDAAQEDMRWMAAYLVLAMLMSAGAAWLAVRWGLTPLRIVADQAARIDMNSLHQRLDYQGVSSEIGPFVEAFNKALERLEIGMARQRRFAANAAHELRTPVSILGARLDAPEEASFRNDLRRDHRRIRNIVEQLLATARLGENSASLDEQVDLCAVARAIIADAALLALRSKRKIALEAPSSPVLIKGNHPALESVLANLIDNALRAEPAGGTVSVRVHEDAWLEVADHGSGVEPADREAIFEPFWRKSESTPGTGLGLAIARELIDAHGGQIGVFETPGGGATFRVAFPELA